MPHVLVQGDGWKELQFTCGSYIYAAARLPVGARVLEIGGGNDPHPGSDLIVDKFPDDNFHRAGKGNIFRGGEFVMQMPDGTKQTGTRQLNIMQGDVVDLPFADKEWDFVIAKDVLEHVEDVEQAFREISRIGKAGLVDVPRFASEWLWPQGEMHKYVFSLADGTFIAHPIAFTTPFGRTMHDALASSAAIQDAWAASRHFFHAVHVWRGSVACVIGAPARLDARACIADLTGGA